MAWEVHFIGFYNLQLCESVASWPLTAWKSNFPPSLNEYILPLILLHREPSKHAINLSLSLWFFTFLFGEKEKELLNLSVTAQNLAFFPKYDSCTEISDETHDSNIQRIRQYDISIDVSFNFSPPQPPFKELRSLSRAVD